MSMNPRPSGPACRACGRIVPADADFCPHCGEPTRRRSQAGGPSFIPLPFADSPEMFDNQSGGIPGAAAWPQSGAPTIPGAPAGPQSGVPGVPGAPAGPQSGAIHAPYALAGPQSGASGVPGAPAGPQSGAITPPHVPAGPQGWSSGQWPAYPGSGPLPPGSSGAFYPPSSSGAFPQGPSSGMPSPSPSGQVVGKAASTSIRAAKTGFSLFKLFAVLAVVGAVAGGTVAALALRHHHLPDGYLYEARSGTIVGVTYFDIQESWYGGDVSGTFYVGEADCSQDGQVQSENLTFNGTVSDDQIVLKFDVGFGISIDLTFARMGNTVVLDQAGALGFSVGVPTEDGTVFQGVSEPFDQVKASVCSG
jgi:hypothetical protein